MPYGFIEKLTSNFDTSGSSYSEYFAVRLSSEKHRRRHQCSSCFLQPPSSSISHEIRCLLSLESFVRIGSSCVVFDLIMRLCDRMIIRRQKSPVLVQFDSLNTNVFSLSWSLDSFPSFAILRQLERTVAPTSSCFCTCLVFNYCCNTLDTQLPRTSFVAIMTDCTEDFTSRKAGAVRASGP